MLFADAQHASRTSILATPAFKPGAYPDHRNNPRGLFVGCMGRSLPWPWYMNYMPGGLPLVLDTPGPQVSEPANVAGTPRQGTGTLIRFGASPSLIGLPEWRHLTRHHGGPAGSCSSGLWPLRRRNTAPHEVTRTPFGVSLAWLSLAWPLQPNFSFWRISGGAA